MKPKIEFMNTPSAKAVALADWGVKQLQKLEKRISAGFRRSYMFGDVEVHLTSMGNQRSVRVSSVGGYLFITQRYVPMASELLLSTSSAKKPVSFAAAIGTLPLDGSWIYAHLLVRIYRLYVPTEWNSEEPQPEYVLEMKLPDGSTSKQNFYSQPSLYVTWLSGSGIGCLLWMGSYTHPGDGEIYRQYRVLPFPGSQPYEFEQLSGFIGDVSYAPQLHTSDNYVLLELPYSIGLGSEVDPVHLHRTLFTKEDVGYSVSALPDIMWVPYAGDIYVPNQHYLRSYGVDGELFYVRGYRDRFGSYDLTYMHLDGWRFSGTSPAATTRRLPARELPSDPVANYGTRVDLAAVSALMVDELYVCATYEVPISNQYVDTAIEKGNITTWIAELVIGPHTITLFDDIIRHHHMYDSNGAAFGGSWIVDIDETYPYPYLVDRYTAAFYHKGFYGLVAGYKYTFFLGSYYDYEAYFWLCTKSGDLVDLKGLTKAYNDTYAMIGSSDELIVEVHSSAGVTEVYSVNTSTGASTRVGYDAHLWTQANDGVVALFSKQADGHGQLFLWCCGQEVPVEWVDGVPLTEALLTGAIVSGTSTGLWFKDGGGRKGALEVLISKFWVRISIAEESVGGVTTYTAQGAFGTYEDTQAWSWTVCALTRPAITL